MKGVLVLAHGSKMSETHEIIEEVVRMLREKLCGIPLELAYMQFSENNLKSAIQKLFDTGVTDLKAVPYFLFNGVHIKNIHEELNDVLKDFPNMKVSVSKTLGADSRLADILFDRINE